MAEQLKDLTTRPTILCNIKTSNEFLSGTTDVVYVWFIGDFASDGPYQIGPYAKGASTTFTFTLAREVGSLTSFFFQKLGKDGWIMRYFTCEFHGKEYLTDLTTLRWLDNFDETIYVENDGNGYEPVAQSNFVASSTMIAPVTGSVQLYSETGQIRY
jgi:hypothetical protein